VRRPCRRGGELAGLLIDAVLAHGMAALCLHAAAVRYLSPLADGSPALSVSRALDTNALAAAYAVRNPGGFGTYRDYRDEPVLVTSRSVPGTVWVLAYKVDRAEALGPTDRRLTRLLAILLLASAGVVAAIVAAPLGGLPAVAAVLALAEIGVFVLILVRTLAFLDQRLVSVLAVMLRPPTQALHILRRGT
jgi:hypothetical protein